MTSSKIAKAIGLPEGIDPDHEYVYKSGVYGLYDYWYQDRHDNYYKYTNAPTDHPDFDFRMGEALMATDQTMPHENPEFYTIDGFKRFTAVPMDAHTDKNAEYSPKDARQLWFEVYNTPQGGIRYIYLDKDVKENLDLFVQGNLRVTDAGIQNYRNRAVDLFQGAHPKDKITGAMMFLVEQGMYEPEELVNATVGDLEFIDQTVKLLGRKFKCDPEFLDFLTSLVGTSAKEDPLFQLDTVHGRGPVGLHYLYAVFYAANTSPVYLHYWRATITWSRIMHILAAEQIPVAEAELRSFYILSQALTTNEDVRWMVDVKVRQSVVQNYAEAVAKALTHVEADDYGTLEVFSDLIQKTDEEMEFSGWLHAEPMHDITPEEQDAINELVAEEGGDEEALEEEDEGAPPQEGVTPPEQEQDAAAPPPEEAAV